MDPESTKKLLADVFSQVAERLAFMFSEPAEEDEFPDFCQQALMATMTFEGPTTGRLTLAVPHDMCPELTANVLGLDPDDDAITESASQDALKELLNITCGHVLTTLAGEEPIFNLSVPEIAPLPNDGWNKLYREAGTCPLLVDDNPVLIHLQLDS